MTLVQAFHDVSQPASEQLTASRDEEAREDVAYFAGKNWYELDDHTALDVYQYALFWFTPEAFHYYLPAFLAAAPDHPDALYVITLGQLLSTTSDPILAEFRKDRWSRLTSMQWEEVRKQLRLVLQNVARDSALDRELEESLRYIDNQGWKSGV